MIKLYLAAELKNVDRADIFENTECEMRLLTSEITYDFRYGCGVSESLLSNKYFKLALIHEIYISLFIERILYFLCTLNDQRCGFSVLMLKVNTS